MPMARSILFTAHLLSERSVTPTPVAAVRAVWPESGSPPPAPESATIVGRSRPDSSEPTLVPAILRRPTAAVKVGAGGGARSARTRGQLRHPPSSRTASLQTGGRPGERRKTERRPTYAVHGSERAPCAGTPCRSGRSAERTRRMSAPARRGCRLAQEGSPPRPSGISYGRQQGNHGARPARLGVHERAPFL